MYDRTPSEPILKVMNTQCVLMQGMLDISFIQVICIACRPAKCVALGFNALSEHDFIVCTA